MKQASLNIPVQIFPDFNSLETADAELLEAARRATGYAYAPYSKFRVGAAVRLANGQILSGSNQENASFPAGICAERVALSAASATFPGIAISSLALTYINESGTGSRPIAPCGICRQTLTEYEQRFGQSIRLVLGGISGEIFIIKRATDLLPFAFSSQELKPELNFCINFAPVMKKLLFVFIISGLVSFFGCGKTAPDNPPCTSKKPFAGFCCAAKICCRFIAECYHGQFRFILSDH